MLSYKEYLNNLEIKAESKKNESKDDEKKKSSKGLTAAQKKLPKALQDAILAKQGKGGSEGKKEESSWWKSIGNMLDADSSHKNWDGGWGEIGKVHEAVRENVDAGGEYAIEVVFKDGRKERYTNSNYKRIADQYEMLSYKTEIDQLTLFSPEGKALANTNSSLLARRNRGLKG